MNKMMFNDKYGLTWAVVRGRKTQTRRVANNICDEITDINRNDFLGQSKYKVGDIVAVAQSYKTICDNSQCEPKCADKKAEIWSKIDRFLPEKVWSNKMFTKPELMPYRIEITGIRIERLNDISEEDCIQEGIMEYPGGWFDATPYAQTPLFNDREPKARTAKEAYARLIDKIGKRGDWALNPWVFVYDFKLVD